MSIQINVPDHILFEDPYIIVLSKPGGLMVEPDRNGHPNLLQQLKKYFRSRESKGYEIYAQHLHRLDRPVSGIVLFAKQRTVLKNLSEQFAERRVKKYYQALTINEPERLNGKLEGWHKKEKKKAVLFDENVPDAERVALDYRVTRFSEEFFQWDIELHTGKYHQIRAQLSAAGCPILGDELYGSGVSYKPNSIALHAAKLIFSHPVSGLIVSVEDKQPFFLKRDRK